MESLAELRRALPVDAVGAVDRQHGYRRARGHARSGLGGPKITNWRPRSVGNLSSWPHAKSKQPSNRSPQRADRASRLVGCARSSCPARPLATQKVCDAVLARAKTGKDGRGVERSAGHRLS